MVKPIKLDHIFHKALKGVAIGAENHLEVKKKAEYLTVNLSKRNRKWKTSSGKLLEKVYHTF